VAEWSIAPVLKTGGSKGPVSSNLTASAKSTGFIQICSHLVVQLPQSLPHSFYAASLRGRFCLP
jgi:hypothetical protein